MFSRSSFRTELDGSAKLLGGGGVRTHNQHTRIHRHHQLRAPIPCASAETEAMESPVERGTILFLRGQINGRERERQEARRARGATDRRSDPRTYFHARASPCFTDPSRKVQHRPRPRARFRPAVLSSYPGVRGTVEAGSVRLYGKF